MTGDFLKRVVQGNKLTATEAAECCSGVLSGSATPVEIAGMLCALHARGETTDELTGFLTSMRAHMSRVTLPDPLAVDLCGTGGDGSHSFNVSTAAALLTAACGVTVAKHGNRAVSSRSGSADVLEALHVPLSTTVEDAERRLREQRFAFLFAPHFHPALKHVAPIRKELGVRTIFNLLGPLANPAGVTRQMIGVFDPRWLRPVVEALALAGSEYVLSVHSQEGLDEVSACGETHYCMLRGGAITEGVWIARTWGLEATTLDAIAGGDAEYNARRLRALANGEERELAEWIIANCAPALVLAEKAGDFAEGVEVARACLRSGQFIVFLNSLVTS